jgi:hypothetical protein
VHALVSHLVDLVEQDDRVLDAALAQSCDNFAGHRADVGSAVASDFRLVANAAE